MTQTEQHKLHFDSLQIHAGQTPDPTTKARAVPIYATSSYVFDDNEIATDLFANRVNGNLYSRITNPTTEVFEKRMAALEGGVAATAISSGMAAIYSVATTLCKTGDNIVSSSKIFGGTVSQFKNMLSKMGIDTKFVNSEDPEDFKAAIDANTKMLFIESISNPQITVADFDPLADIAHEAGIPFVVDNTMGAGGYIIRPIEHGADIVVHSATKWIGGHGTTIGGVIVDAGKFNWANGNFPDFTKPVDILHGSNFWEAFGQLSLSQRLKIECLRDIGPCQSPFNSFLLLQGLESLSVRVQRHLENALALAEWLASRDDVAWVIYPGLKNDSSHERAKKYLRGFGAVLTFGPKGSPKIFTESVQMASNLINLGDVKTLVFAPGITALRHKSEEQLKYAHIPRNMVRVSVGIEHIDDIKWDFDQAFKKANNFCHK